MVHRMRLTTWFFDVAVKTLLRVLTVNGTYVDCHNNVT